MDGLEKIRSAEGQEIKRSCETCRAYGRDEGCSFPQQVCEKYIQIETVRTDVCKKVVLDFEEFSEAEICEIQEYFDKQYNIQLDEFQAEAIASKANNILVTAPAGSGKTRVIVSKILHLIDKQKIPINSVLVLAFNKKVPEEINSRIESAIKKNRTSASLDNHINVAKTFHEFSASLVEPQKIIKGEIRNGLVKCIIEDLERTSPEFKTKVYQVFRKERQIYKRDFRNTTEFYQYIRNYQYQTLDGEFVKSKGEKWIADFLFEHDIKYIYEKEFYPGSIVNDKGAFSGTEDEEAFVGTEDEKNRCKNFLNDNSWSKTTIPDFYLKDFDLVWEHWGVDEREKDPKRKEDFKKTFDISWDEYKVRMEWKRKFWSPKWRKQRLRPELSRHEKSVSEIKSVNELIETSIADMRSGREQFEQTLKEILMQKGVNVEKLDKDTLVARVWENQIDQFCVLIVSFIDKYQQRYINCPTDVFEAEIERYRDKERVYTFLQLGLDVYKRYVSILGAPEKPKHFSSFEGYFRDFNQLVDIARQSVARTLSSVEAIHYILIDEYQDFSELFYQLIKTICEKNPQIKLFCVGDSWQAINRFMGADTCYFDKFEEYFSNSRKVSILNNYRSTRIIVDASNRFIGENSNRKHQANKSSHNHGAVIEKINVDTVWLECQKENASTVEYEKDQAYIRLLSPQGQEAISMFDYKTGRYIKKCIEIIKENEGMSVLILHRKNLFRDKYSLELVENKLLHYLSKGHDKGRGKISVSTIHKSKGLEADVVIFLEANRKYMPLLHPNSELYSVFGETPEIAIADEKRLFYVAITRARSKLYFLHDEDISPYVAGIETESDVVEYDLGDLSELEAISTYNLQPYIQKNEPGLLSYEQDFQ